MRTKVPSDYLDLKAKEKKLFDTYKSKRDNKSKVEHLREMANVIEEIDKYESINKRRI